MEDFMGPLTRRIFDTLITIALTREQQARLGFHIMCRARGEGDDDPCTNGEYRILVELKRHLQGQKAILFDVGANQGTWTITAAQDMRNLSLYAFEPSAMTFDVLCNAIAAERLGGCVTPVQAALGNVDGKGTLHVAGPLAGTNSLYLRDAKPLGVCQEKFEEIVLVRGDTFCRDRGIERIDFVKIDTEGHEMAVLEGFGDMISEGRVDCIQFEYGGTWIDARKFLGDAFRFLCPRGYRIGKVHPGGIRFLDGYDQREETFTYANYLAVRPDRAKWVPSI